jgi:prephenate dehydrogenase
MTAFKNIAIVGVGLIGGSLGLAIKRKFPNVTITGISSEGALDGALKVGAIDAGLPKIDLEKGVAEADLIFLCNPILKILDMIPKVARAVKDGALVTDVGSTKKKIVDCAGQHFKGQKYFLGGHPMAGSEGRGIQHADALLFENSIYVLTPQQNIPVPITQHLGNLLESIGAKVLFINPITHDKVAAAISHLPQILAVTLVNLVAKHDKDTPFYLKLAAGGFRDMTRIASSPYEIWKDILDTNHKEISKFIDAFIVTLRDNQKRLSDEKLAIAFEDAARYRLSIPRDTKGFLRPHYDLSIRVEDKPGVIAEISMALANKKINIKDIEVLKVREGDSGTIRISLETPGDREQAQMILKKIGYFSRIRN